MIIFRSENLSENKLRNKEKKSIGGRKEESYSSRVDKKMWKKEIKALIQGDLSCPIYC